jgi:hypothetical protein
MVRLPVSMRLIVDALRWVLAATSSSDSPSVRRKLRSRLRTRSSIAVVSPIRSPPPPRPLANSARQHAIVGLDHIVADMTDHAHHTIERHCDVAVIGGSAAGLAAALQLGGSGDR